MSREQIGRLIAAVQSRDTPPERLPISESDGASDPVPARSPVPDWLSPDWLSHPLSAIAPPFQIIPLEPDDEITIESDGPDDSGLSLPGLEFPDKFDGGVPPFDVLAYYLPFHFYRNRWGIYLLESGILEVARHIVGGDYINWQDRWIIGLAAKALFLHEFFHHAVEVACSRLEFPLPTTLAGNVHYNSYFTNPIAASNEESLANAYVARNIRRYYGGIRPTPLKKGYWALRSFMDRQPGPYANYRKFVRDEDYARGRDTLVTQMYEPHIFLITRQPGPGSILGASMYFADVTPASSQYPIYLVLDSGQSHIRIAKPFPKDLGIQVFVYSNDHTPTHIHVRDLDGNLSTRYLWPSLDPYPDDPRLSRRKENSLKAYVAEYSEGLSQRVAAVYGLSA